MPRRTKQGQRPPVGTAARSHRLKEKLPHAAEPHQRPRSPPRAAADDRVKSSTPQQPRRPVTSTGMLAHTGPGPPPEKRRRAPEDHGWRNPRPSPWPTGRPHPPRRAVAKLITEYDTAAPRAVRATSAALRLAGATPDTDLDGPGPRA